MSKGHRTNGDSDSKSNLQRIRELEQENRSLKKRYNRLLKDISSGRFKADVEELTEEYIEPENVPKEYCANLKCGTDKVKVMKLSIRGQPRTFIICQECGHRHRKKDE
jgi:DNA-directed RNA polymerase subunit M/transcription elongation factor TFIIS